MSSEDSGYTRYMISLKTVNNGVIKGNLGQHLNEVVGMFYGHECGYLPWHEDGYCAVIVKPKVTTVVREDVVPTLIRTEQEIVDWVLGMEQRPDWSTW